MSEKPKENLIQEKQSPQETSNPNRQGLEVAVSSGPNSLQERLGTLGDAITHDQQITAENLSDLDSSFEGMKLSIGSKELTFKDAEGLAAINIFLKEAATEWSAKEEDGAPLTFKLEFVDPKDLDYKNKTDNPDKSKSGQYTLNPETFGMDFEKAKVFVPDLHAWEGKKRGEVFKYVADTYGDQYSIPGIEYWKWMLENPDKAEEAVKKQGYDIKNGKYYHFPGSSFCHGNGHWAALCSFWFDVKFYRGSPLLESEWGSNSCVVLLEREK